MQLLMDARFWFTTVLVLVIVSMLLSGRNLRAKGWLLGSVLLSWAVLAVFYVPMQLLSLGLLPSDLHKEIVIRAATAAGFVDILSWVLLLIYVAKARAIANQQVSAQHRAQYTQMLDPAAEYDVIELAENGAVSVSGTGRDITQVQAMTRNLTAKPLRVVIQPGTCFTSSGAHQNMVAVEATRFALAPQGEEQVMLRAACVNAERPIPSGADGFSGVHRVPDMLTRFLQAAIHASPMVRQAGVWALTDDYSAAAIRAHLTTRDRDGNQRPAISDDDIAEAKRLLDSVGARHRL